MARLHLRLETNVDGDFYVDETCIDCAACRWIAPDSFDMAVGQSRVHTQPTDERTERQALLALVACPTASIGAEGDHDVRGAQRAFPRPIAERVLHCGFHSEKSFGAASYLVLRDGGNVLIDSPRYNKSLGDRIDDLGGVSQMFLTHRDDVADHAKWHERFGCERIIHARDRTASTSAVERVIEGEAPARIADDLLVIPTPGHTRGSACLLFEDRVLLSGDHVAYDTKRQAVYAFRRACWYDWETQIDSMKRLLDHRFEWILPGHGAPCHFDSDRMREEIAACVAWMQAR